VKKTLSVLLDFVHDQFVFGRRFRILNIVNDVTRECLAAIPDTSISGKRVARELTMLIDTRGKPQMIVFENGAEFTSNAILGWDRRTTRQPGFGINQVCRERSEEVFGWIKEQAGLAKFKVRGRAKAEAVFTFAVAAYNLIRIPKLLAESPA